MNNDPRVETLNALQIAALVQPEVLTHYSKKSHTERVNLCLGISVGIEMQKNDPHIWDRTLDTTPSILFNVLNNIVNRMPT